jgi:hypothetical protein
MVEDFNGLKERAAGLNVRGEGPASKELTLQGGEEALRHGIVVAVADRAHRAADACGLTALAEKERGLVAAVIRVVDEPVPWSPVPDGHLQRSDDELGAPMIRHGPPHDAPAERIEDESQVEEPVALCRHVGDVGDPQLIGRARHNCALNQIWRRLSVWIALCDVERAPTMAPR